MGRILAPRCPDLFEIPEHKQSPGTLIASQLVGLFLPMVYLDLGSREIPA